MELRPAVLSLLLVTLMMSISPVAIQIAASFEATPVHSDPATSEEQIMPHSRPSSGEQDRTRKQQPNSRRIVHEDSEPKSAVTLRKVGHDQLELAKLQAVLMMNSRNKNTPPLFLTKTRDFLVDVARHPLGTKIATMQAVDMEGDQLTYSLQPTSLHDASPYFSVDHERGDLILEHKQFPYYTTEVINEHIQTNAAKEEPNHEKADEGDEEEEGEGDDEFSVNKNLYFLNVAADDGRYSSIVELQIHVVNSSSLAQPRQHSQDTKMTVKSNASSGSKTGRPATISRQSKNQTTPNSASEFSAKTLQELPATTSRNIPPKQPVGSELIPETQSSYLLDRTRLPQPNDGQQPDQLGPLIPQPVIVSLVVACSCLMIALVLLIFIIPLSMKLRRRLRHVERQHEHLSQQNSNGSSIVCSSSGSMATHSHMPSLSQFTLGSDRSCHMGGSSVQRQSSIDSSITSGLPLSNPNMPLNRINNGSIVNPLYLQQQHHLMPDLQLDPAQAARQRAYLMDEPMRGGMLNHPSDATTVNNDYYPLDDDFYSTINTESTALNDLSYQRKPFNVPMTEKPLDAIDEAGKRGQDSGDTRQELESPNSDSGSSIRSLVRFLSLPDRRHANQATNQGANLGPETKTNDNTALANLDCKQQFRTIARASDVAREQVNNDSNHWELERHKLRFLAILDEGQFGLVWRCELKISNAKKQIVAVKTLKNSALQDERGKEELLAEIRIMKMVCQHPNVVKILHCCTSDVSFLDSTPSATHNKPILLVMEYVELGKLQSFLEKSRVNHRYATNLYTNTHATSDHLTSRDLIKFIYHVAKGMEYISGQCIVHRDLASRNILVSSERICKIGDFGMARHMQSLADVYERHSRNTKVPVRWMAPEVLKDNKFTTKSDVFSFGILMWEIVTLGSTPYRYLQTDKIPKEVAYKGKRPEKPDYCHPQLYEIMSRCWSHEPNERPTFSCLVKQLDEFLLSSYDYIELDQYPDNNYYNIPKTDAPNELL